MRLPRGSAPGGRRLLYVLSQGVADRLGHCPLRRSWSPGRSSRLAWPSMGAREARAPQSSKTGQRTAPSIRSMRATSAARVTS